MISQLMVDGFKDVYRRADREKDPDYVLLMRIKHIIELKRTSIADLENYFAPEPIPFWILYARNEFAERHRTTKATVPNWAYILEIGVNATVKEIKSAYRQKALKAHPDAGGDHEQFLLINAAYKEALKSK